MEKKSSTSKRGASSYKASQDSYIAAELDKNSESFMVGDNRTYAGYYNPPLQKGATYDIRQGSVSKAGDQVIV